MDGQRRFVPRPWHTRRQRDVQEARAAAARDQERGRGELTLKIAIHRLDQSVALPRYESSGAAGFDLASNADLTIAPGEVTLVPTGLVIALPPGHFLGIFARSSTPLKRGLMVANGVGIVDSDYCGPNDEIKIEVVNFTSKPVQVKKGDRLAQGVVLPFVRVEWDETNAATGVTRGGFGSTGV